MTAHSSLSASIEPLEDSFEAARGNYARLNLIVDALQHRGAQRLCQANRGILCFI